MVVPYSWVTGGAIIMSAVVMILLVWYMFFVYRKHRAYNKRIDEVNAILDDIDFQLEPQNKTIVIMVRRDGFQFVLNRLQAEASPILRDFGNYERVPYSKAAAIEAGMPQKLQ